MKLELKHLAPYLPYGLTWFCLDEDSREIEHLPTVKIYDLEKQIIEIGGMDIDLSDLPYPDGLTIKPILRPLCDFYENIDGVSFSNMITHGYHNTFWYDKNFNINGLMYRDLKLLLSKHADVFGLIKKGLAIDINTI